MSLLAVTRQVNSKILYSSSNDGYGFDSYMYKEFVCVHLRDINGNSVGTTEFTDSKIEQRIRTFPKKKGKR